MTAPAIARVERSMAAIVCDLATTRQRQKSLWASCLGRDPDDEEDALWTDLDGRRDALEDEFRASFRAFAGVDWELASEVMA